MRTRNCELCGTADGRFVSDHCHYHGQIRGIICHQCNIRMGRADKGMPVSKPWVPAEIIAEYRSRCTRCDGNEIDAVSAARFSAPREPRDLASLMPIPELPEPSERIRLRNLFKATQSDLATEIGITRKAVYAWEHGISNPVGLNREAYAALLKSWADTEKLTREAREAATNK
jgi:DNA-binding XRE family transcriptional regulator